MNQGFEGLGLECKLNNVFVGLRTIPQLDALLWPRLRLSAVMYVNEATKGVPRLPRR